MDLILQEAGALSNVKGQVCRGQCWFKHSDKLPDDISPLFYGECHACACVLLLLGSQFPLYFSVNDASGSGLLLNVMCLHQCFLQLRVRRWSVRDVADGTYHPRLDLGVGTSLSLGVVGVKIMEQIPDWALQIAELGLF